MNRALQNLSRATPLVRTSYLASIGHCQRLLQVDRRESTRRRRGQSPMDPLHIHSYGK